MLLGAMPEESPAAALVTKTRATDFSIAAIMARGGAANRKQQQPCRTSVQTPPTLPVTDGKSSNPYFKLG